MKKIKKVLLHKNTHVVFIFITVLIAFHNFWTNQLDKLVAAPLFSEFNTTWLLDILLIPILLHCFYNTYTIVKINRKTNSAHIFAVCTLVCVYAFYRITNSTWDFYGLYCCSNVKYFDVMAFYLILPVIAYIKSSVTNNKLPDAEGAGFVMDEPIGVDGEDDFLRGKVAKEIADRIKNTRNNTSVAIGINGKWGSGKTSFLNLIRREINNETSIIVDFNPWLSKSPDLLINDFFETLSQQLTQYDSSIGYKLNSYAQKLTEFDSNSVTKIIRTTIDHFFSQKTVTLQKKAINNIIESTGKQVIILIDDLDRLDKKEVIETIRLIRNTANFENTFFIVAYDREYVIKALSGITDHSPEFYLEKIFQIELPLPTYEKTTLNDKLLEKFIELKIEADSIHLEIKDMLLDSVMDRPSMLDRYLLNLRDVSRFANSFSLSYKFLDGEVIVKDLIHIECIRLKYPSVYNLLYTDYDKIFTRKELDSKSLTDHIRLTRVVNADKTSNTVLKVTLEENHKELGIPRNQIDKIVRDIEKLFSDPFVNNLGREQSHLSIKHIKGFGRYFAQRLLKTDLSNKEFLSVRNKSISDLKNQIDKWVEKGLSFEVGTRLLSISQYSDAADFEKIIDCLFYLSNLPNSSYSINNRDVYNIVGYSKDQLVDVFYNGTEADYINALKRIIMKSDVEFRAENEFRRYLIDEDSVSLFAKEELLNANIDTLKKHLMQIDGFSNLNLRFWRNCSIKAIAANGQKYSKDERKYSDKANQLMLNFIIPNFDAFIIAIIDQADPEHKKLYKISDIVNTLYNNYTAFEITVDQLSEEKFKYLAEFKTFLKKYADNKFNPTEFNFKTIPVVNRWHTIL